MEYIATHYQMDLALTWAIRLQGMTDQEKFKELGKIFSPRPIKTQNQQQSWLSSMLTGVILNPHQPQKKNPIKQSSYLTITAFYQKRDGKQSFA